MTAFQKIAVTVALAIVAAAISAALYEANQAASARVEAQRVRSQQARFEKQMASLHADIADMTNQLANLLAENSRLKKNPNETELLKLRGEVTRLRPLQDDVIALQQKLKQSSANLIEWKTNDLADVGRANPIDALETYIYSSQKFDPAKIQNSIVGDDVDPPDPELLQNFIKSESNHPQAGDGMVDYKILSQTRLGPDKVQVELNATFGDSGMGVSTPFTLQNINGEWKLVVFNVRDQYGKFNHLAFINPLVR